MGTPQDLQIGPMPSERWPEVLALLQDCGLPEAGLAGHRDAVQVVLDGDVVVGCVAVERHGRFGLLRSLAVREDYRGRGLGLALTRAAVVNMGQAAPGALYLLTETAEPFFAANGFRTVSRAGVPAEIQGTVEFSEACPASAAVMVLAD